DHAGARQPSHRARPVRPDPGTDHPARAEPGDAGRDVRHQKGTHAITPTRPAAAGEFQPVATSTTTTRPQAPDTGPVAPGRHAAGRPGRGAVLWSFAILAVGAAQLGAGWVGPLPAAVFTAAIAVTFCLVAGARALRVPAGFTVIGVLTITVAGAY